LQIKLDEKTILLKESDSLFFEADRRHVLENAGQKEGDGKVASRDPQLQRASRIKALHIIAEFNM
jgi:hypothetical protein